MAPLTYTLIIGISEYQEKVLENLPGAKCDAIHFARALKNWGVAKGNSHFLLDAEASCQHVMKLLDDISRINDPFTFIFYFCGHGYRTPAPAPKSHLLLQNSLFSEEHWTNSVTIDYLMERIAQTNCKESYFFIDACALRINSMVHPQLKDEVTKRSDARKSFFCLLSSGIHPSYERVGADYGYFTDALLRSFARNRTASTFPLPHLVEEIRRDLDTRELPPPEMYNIEASEVTFFPDLSEQPREALLAKFQDFLIANRGKLLCLIGEEGIGKTTFISQLVNERFHVQVLRDCKNIKRQDSGFLLILDISDREKITSSIPLLISAKFQIVLILRKSLFGALSPSLQDQIVDWPIPPLSIKESKELVDSLNPNLTEESKEMVILASKGNPKRIRQLIQEPKLIINCSSKEKEIIQRAIEAVHSCGLFLNEELFCLVFHLPKSVLWKLENMGLIAFSEGKWTPHELLSEIAEGEGLQIDSHGALEYWYQQLDELPHQNECGKALLLLLKCFGYEQRAESYLTQIYKNLSKEGKDALPYLIDAAEMYLSSDFLPPSALYLASLLIRFSQWSFSKKLLSLKAKTFFLKNKAHLLLVQCLWREGNMQKALEFTRHLQKYKFHPRKKFEVRFQKAVALFLLGDWTESEKEFTKLEFIAQHSRDLGWIKCMLGTIWASKKENPSQGKEALIEGIRLLAQMQNLIDAWVGWNNLGEILLKLNEYKQSQYYLEKALQAAELSSENSMKMETQRNLLELYSRKQGSHTREVQEILQFFEQSDLSLLDPYVEIPLSNTLARVYFLKGELKKGASLLRKLIHKTINHPHNHLHTLANLALYSSLLGKQEKADYFFRKAISQGRKIGDYLFLSQTSGATCQASPFR